VTSRLRVLAARLLGLVALQRRDADLQDEIDTHLDLLAAEHLRRGLASDAARAAARRDFGGIEQIKEVCRDQHRFRFLDAVARDLRFGLRQLRKNPGFAVVAIGSIAIGIAATAAVFAFLDPLVLNPLPYADADRMVTMAQVNKQGEGRGGVPLSGQEFAEFQTRDVFDAAIATAGWDMTMSSGDLPERVFAGQLSGDSFRYFGLAPALGRTLTSDDAPLNGEPRPVAVLSYRFWKSHYGGKTAILGESIRLDAHPYTIIGVASARFHHSNADVYLPLRRPSDPQNRFGVEARLRADVTLERAEAELQPWFSRLAEASPGRFLPDVHLKLFPVLPRRARPSRDTFNLLFGAATLLLAVGCANVAILLLARGATRQHEIAVRHALGASCRRIIGQLLIESVILAMIGGSVGIAVAWWGVLRSSGGSLKAFCPTTS
jgi:predicted permease